MGAFMLLNNDVSEVISVNLMCVNFSRITYDTNFVLLKFAEEVLKN